jgi:hypothetical protein
MQFRNVVADVIVQSGLLTDELVSQVSVSSGLPASSYINTTDDRDLTEAASTEFATVSTVEYPELHKLRGQARLARGVLAGYAPDVSPAVRGQLYAYEAYADVLLADLYCSGVPLSTVDFNGDYTYAKPSTTDQIYTQAVALFDSALAISADSADIMTLARVGKGRALLALRQYDAAATAVASVGDGDVYRLRIQFMAPDGTLIKFSGVSVSDREGINGFPFLSGGDPRTASDTVTFASIGNAQTVHFPNKYVLRDSTWFIAASGIEARLIQAEAALQAGSGTWLTILNTLRTTGSFTRIDTVAGQPDTVWTAGTGGVAGLGPLADPGTDTGRVTMLFNERAAWLFMTAHREGDLRRLVRAYGRAQDAVYPTGPYSGPSTTGLYGSYIDKPIPPAERRNPNFTGCLSRD